EHHADHRGRAGLRNGRSGARWPGALLRETRHVALAISQLVQLRRADATCRSRRKPLGGAPAGVWGYAGPDIALSEPSVITLDERCRRARSAISGLSSPIG